MKAIKKLFALFFLILTFFTVSDLFAQGCPDQYLNAGAPTGVTLLFSNHNGTINKTCDGPASGSFYAYDQYQCDFEITGQNGQFLNSTFTPISSMCQGWDSWPEPYAESCCPYGEIVGNPTSEYVHFRTYVYFLRDRVSGKEYGWYPCMPQDARVVYKLCYNLPTLSFRSSMTYDHYNNMFILPRTTYGYLYLNNNTNINCYYWCLMLCDPNSNCLTLPSNNYGILSTNQNNGNNFWLYNTSYNGQNCPSDGIPSGLYFYEKLTVWNHGNCSASNITSPKIKPVNYQIGGCPWLWVQCDSELVAENNAFYKSEFTEFYGSDMKDLYILQNKPAKDSNNNILLELSESTSDYTLFDQIQLYAVEHSSDTKLGITENGDIITYSPDEVTSTNNALLNKDNEITTRIQYMYLNANTVKGVSSDSIYAQYDSTKQLNAIKLFKSKIKKLHNRADEDSMALIGNLGHNPDIDYIIYPVQNKDWAGNVAIYTGSGVTERKFARRERASDIFIPFGPADEIIDHIDVDFTNDYEVTYFSIVPIHYYGFTKTELDLVSAEHNIEGDVALHLSDTDQDYAYLDSTSVLTLRFLDNTDPEPGMVRDYVIEYNGHYTIPGRQSIFDKNTLQTGKNYISPNSFVLNQNYPNPFNPVTKIKYSILQGANTSLKIYNALGQLIATLVNSYQQSGDYEVNFNGENYPSGLYFYVLESGDFISTRKMVLLK